MHPLDLIKTRLQLQSASLPASDPNHYSGVRDCMVKMYRQEGLRSFWKGLIPPVMVETPKRAWKVSKIVPQLPSCTFLIADRFWYDLTRRHL